MKVFIDPENVYPPYTAAYLLGVNPKTLAKWAREGKAPHFKTPSGQRRYKESHLKEMAETMKLINAPIVLNSRRANHIDSMLDATRVV